MQNKMKRGYGYYIKHINMQFSALVDEELKEFNLTRSQEDVLRFLHEHRSETIIQKDIEEFFHISNPTVTGLLNRLEQKGFIKRVPSDKDKRIKMIQPTEEIEKHFRDILNALRKVEGYMTKDFNEEELETFFYLLQKANNNLKKEEQND